MKDKLVRVITKKCIIDSYRIITSNNILLNIILPNALDQEILKMFWLDDLECSEIAKKLNLSYHQVKTKYENLLRKIPKRLDNISKNYIDLLKIASNQEIKNDFIKKQVKLMQEKSNPALLAMQEVINPKNIFIKDVLGDRGVRVVNILNKRSIYTLGNLTYYTKSEILLIPGMGKYYVEKLFDVMFQYGLNFKNRSQKQNDFFDEELRFRIYGREHKVLN